MKVIIAIDSFKGCLSSAEAASTIAEGFAGHECVVLPVSDGGEGFAAVLTAALGGRTVCIETHDPLGRLVETQYGIIDGPSGPSAVIDSAAASGLTLMRQDELDPLHASSRGTGELIADAIRRGIRSIYVGFGGTGTNDGGSGMLEALEDVKDLWNECRFTGLCDVTATFCGPDGATAVYGPQKGVRPEQVALLDERLRALAGCYRSVLGRDVLTKPGSGAAGGMAGALWAVLGAELKSGADAVLDILQFEKYLPGAGLVVTGEGRIDAQTLQGKLPIIVARRAKAFSPTLRVVALTGRIDLPAARTALSAHPTSLSGDVSAALRDHPLFDSLIEINPPGTPLSEALDPSFARIRLKSAVEGPICGPSTTP